MSRPLLTVVIPIYNSELSIAELFQLLSTVLNQDVPSFEIIGVNDGSVDGSWQLLKQQAFLYDNVTAINLDRNYGQQAATLCGIMHATGEYIATIDDDLEYHPEDIKTLLFAIGKTNLKIIYGYAEKKGRSAFTNAIARMAKTLVYGVSGLSPHISSFRIIRSEACKELRERNSSHFLVDGLLKDKIGEDHSHVIVKQSRRKYGKSNYTFVGLVVSWIRFLYASSRFGVYFSASILAINIAFILNGYLWIALALGMLAIVSTYLTLSIKWVERKSFAIKEKV